MIHVYVQGDALSLFDLTPFINLSDRNLSVVCNAEQGSVGTSSFVVDDTGAEIIAQLNGLRFVFIDEDEAPPEHQRVFVGFTASRDVTRIDAPVGASRQFNVQVEDINGLLSRRVMTGGDNNRPAESDVERVEWLMGTGESGHFDDTVTFIDTSGPVDMDADVNYEGQMFNAVLDDCAQQSGKNYYARWLWNDYLDDYESAIWYGPDDAPSALSNLRISNIRSDVDAEVGHDDTFPDSSTWGASLDSKLTIDPSRVFYGVFANYDGGVTYRSLSTTRDTITSWPNVKTLAQANARSDRYLATLGVEEEVVSTSILVPPANVNDAMAGDEISVRFSHFPGWEEFRAVRILNRTVTFVTPEVYQIDYELTPIDTTPPVSCTTALASAEVYSSGAVNDACHDWSSGPIAQAIGLTPADASAIIACYGSMQCSFAPGPYVSLSSPYTMVGSGTDNLGCSGYLANVTDGDIFSANFTGGDVSWHSVVAVAIPTSASAPVQSAYQEGSGGSVTLPNPPTVGNILVTASWALRNGPIPISGWNNLVADSSLIIINGLNGVGVLITAKCVDETDTNVIPVPSSAFAHSNFVTEWTP